MKIRGALALASLLAVPLWAGEPSPASSAGQGPRIAAEPQSFDFGQALQNRTLSKEFAIKNFGTADWSGGHHHLQLQHAPWTENKVIKPGGSTPLGSPDP